MTVAKMSDRVVEAARAKGVLIATAESCTGGLIAAALTDVAGSSAVFDRGFVTYSNEAKSQMLDVDANLIEAHGAVSREVAVAMAEGAFRNSPAELAVAVTGTAGPGGGSSYKPVGTVHVAVAGEAMEPVARHCTFADEGVTDRAGIRRRTVETALEVLLEALT